MNAIILCGGLSTRLGEITKAVPKVLLEVKGKTVLDWQLEKLKAAGVAEVVLAAGHLAEVLKSMAGDERQGVRLVYAVEPEKLGTGGAIKFAWQHLKNTAAPSIVWNGDILTTVDITAMRDRLRSDSEGIILGARVDDAGTYETLAYDVDGRLREFKKRDGRANPGYINGGLYILTPAALQHFPSHAAFSMEYDVFPRMQNVDVFESHHPWIDIGVPERLTWAREKWGSV